ncbi:DNA polymerase delta subunit 4 [Histoplasma capsulatum var. duboisii H88]|uniref:DNA polymerase delta subunit 4 n=2 Tax=Ajellomyces capsulatus TaxID=5037 RepID=F0UVU4_AJEC8|nr:DNA polymerase delta subunit 4 [Histoplasma capsulatum H143]EGC50021.1 DNA polymerase delta subunit 4 [Histoplasma capsulatum var. duboisii H88]QSS50778.1 DNA polymerase delta subunit 4 [Histoplasma capsulatum var. duboisii H88]
MPATTRRRSGNSNQSTLSFGAQHKVSKPTTISSSLAGKKGKKTTDVSSPAGKLRRRGASGSVSPVSVTSPAVEPPSPKANVQCPAEIESEQKPSRSENIIAEQARVELRLRKSEEDRRAEELTEEDIRKYWENEEAGRLAPRVHQEHLTVHEKILRHFDLSNQYGPCIGIARLKRWRRAQMLNLNPPIEVLAVLLKDEAKGIANEKAYIDELMS